MSDAVLPYEAQPVTRQTFDQYCAEVPSFEASELEAVRRNGRRCFVGMCAGFGLSGVLGLSLHGTARENVRLARGFEVRPVLVDKSTGESFQIRRPEALPETAAETHTKHMAWQYVTAREGYSAAEDKRRFDTVVAMSDVGEQKRFKRWWEEERDGPRVELTRDGRAEVQTRALPELRRDDPKATKGPYTHLVYRFGRTIERPRHETQSRNMLATIFFGWDNGYTRSDDLLVNPFGFVVTRYMRTWESA